MITDLEEFCRLFYNTTAIPVTYYDIAINRSCSFPCVLGDSAIFTGTLPGFMQFTQNPDYFISQSFSYFGCVKSESGNGLVIIGPVFSTPASDFTLQNFMKEWAVPSVYRQDIAQFLANAPAISFSRFLENLAYLHLCLNDKKVDVRQHFQLNSTDRKYEFSRLHPDQIVESKENQNFHNTYHFERKLLQYIQDGDSEKIRTLLQTTEHLTEGTLADNALRQRKNIFITTIALVARSAIAGGMDMEQAYQLSDVYIMECENTQSISYVSSLEYTMLIDFAERVAQNKIPQGMSKEIFDCIQYITRHTNEPIQVSDVATYIGKSRSYLSERFKKELGFDVSSFIMRCKLEEAKSLLTYSGKSLCDISSYLCFSSQSYFQNVFKKKYGITPRQYRDQTQRIR